MRNAIIFTLVAALALASCAPTEDPAMPSNQTSPVQPPAASENAAIATFAGGCFWCMEPPFEKLEGVASVTSGYAGGEEEAPTYEQVSSGSTGHRESVQVSYDPKTITYKELLDVYWRQIDPTDDGGSFVDRGFQYTSAIFYRTEEERALAEESKRLVEERLGKPIAVAIVPFTTFYPAEDYHQDYHARNPLRYTYYRSRSGRDDYIKSVWHKDNSSLWQQQEGQAGEQGRMYAKPSDAELRERLTPLQYKVTQENGTEPAFKNALWDNHARGIYVDIVSGEPLFSSEDKYDSGTGWPSFTRPLEQGNIVLREDKSWFSTRTEVRSMHGDSHLGHVFDDGPAPTGKRYCMNSAALRFIPVEDLEEEGYGEYVKLFTRVA